MEAATNQKIMKLSKRIMTAALCLGVLAGAFAEGEKVIQLYKNNEIFREFSASDVDFIEVNDRVGIPASVDAEQDEKSISITWQPVEGATYNVYRSADKMNFTLIAEGVVENRYVDNAPLSGANFYRIKAVVDGVESQNSAVASAEFSDDALPSGVYLGVSGFNQILNSHQIERLTKRTFDEFNGFVDGLEMKNGTILCYSVDQALNALKSAELPADLSNAAIITFSDGFDQGSLMLNYDYETEEEYLDSIHSRMINEKIGDLNLKAYSIGLQGSDVEDKTLFNQYLQKLASSPSNAYLAENMDAVNARFKEIAKQLTQRNYMQTLRLRMPGIANGSRVCFTFDNRPASTSNYYITGTFNLNENMLENIEYSGLTSSAGTTVKGEADGIFVDFTFEDVHTVPNALITSGYTNEYVYDEENRLWQINSEFDRTENSEVFTSNSSAAIMLVLDCSSSLGSDFAKAKTNAKDFIKTLYDVISETAPTDYINENSPIVYKHRPTGTFFGYEYVDLGLPSGLNWATCNVGATTPYEAGDHFAWGEISTKEDYSTETSLMNGVSMSSFSGNPEYDAAQSRWGGIWRTPTYSEFKELVDRCSWYPVYVGSQLGYRVVGPNGNSIFLPTTGFMEGTEYFAEKTSGVYWTASQYSSDGESSYGIQFFDNTKSFGGYSRYYGCSIRPVSETPKLTDVSLLSTTPVSLWLSVKIDGERYYISQDLYDQFDLSNAVKEGVTLVTNGGMIFILALEDAQSSAISYPSSAFSNYGNIIPTADQGRIICANWGIINSAISKFGGTPLHDYYYTQETVDVLGLYFSSCIGNGTSGSSGLNNPTKAPYVRGVITIQ